VSNSSVRVAFAFFVVSTCATVSFALHADSAPTENVPITTIDPNGVGKCLKDSRVTGGVHKRPKIVHSIRLCWAAQDFTNGPGV
jgi:hypothetical protein